MARKTEGNVEEVKHSSFLLPNLDLCNLSSKAVFTQKALNSLKRKKEAYTVQLWKPYCFSLDNF